MIKWLIFFKIANFFLLVYLDTLGGSFGTWDLQSLLRQEGSLVEPCELLVAVCGI